MRQCRRGVRSGMRSGAVQKWKCGSRGVWQKRSEKYSEESVGAKVEVEV